MLAILFAADIVAKINPPNLSLIKIYNFINIPINNNFNGDPV